MSASSDPATEPQPPQPHRQGVPHDRGPVVGPDDVDAVDHTEDRVRIDGEESAIPGEWL